MKRGSRKYCLLLAVALASATQAWAQAPALTTGQIHDFLLTAEVIAAEQTEKGTTQPWRLTLSDGTLTHDAQFQSVDRNEGARRFGDRYERNFIDSYRYNCAAYQLAKLLGLGDMMPVTVERKWEGKKGSLSWWVDDVMFDEQTRRETRQWPVDMARWSAQMARMLIFAELVQDTDRNQGNVVYTNDWTLKMIDFTRAFRRGDELQRPNDLRHIDRAFFEQLQALTKDGIEARSGAFLRGNEIDSVLKRRDVIVDHLNRLIETRGESLVLRGDSVLRGDAVVTAQ